MITQSNKEFELFFRENFSSVYALLKSYVKDSELAADLTQEAFTRMFENKEKILSLEHGKAFLYTTARYLYWNHCKHERAKKIYLESLDENETEDYNFLQEVTRQETIQILYTAINKLPKQTSKVIYLNLKGKTNTEIAKELQISVNTVKFLKKQAYKKLRTLLSKNYFLMLFFLLGDKC